MMIKCHFSSEMNYHGHNKKEEKRQIMIVMSEQIPFKLIITQKKTRIKEGRRGNSFRNEFDVRIIAEVAFKVHFNLQH